MNVIAFYNDLLEYLKSRRGVRVFIDGLLRGASYRARNKYAYKSNQKVAETVASKNIYSTDKTAGNRERERYIGFWFIWMRSTVTNCLFKRF